MNFIRAAVLAPGESILVMPFPESDQGKIGVLRFTTDLPVQTRIFGRFRGELPGEAGTVQLVRPIDSADRNSPEIVIEQAV